MARRLDAAASAHQQGLAAYKTSSFEMAIELFSQAITIDPTRAATYHARAKTFEKLGRIRDALTDAREVVVLRPTSYEGFFLAGRLYKLAGKLEKAEQLLAQALTKTTPAQTAERKAIERERDSASASLARAQFSPLSSLPTELFVEIISLALTSYHSHLSLRPTSSSPPSTLPHPVLVASAVCRSWRRTTESAPRLWSHLFLNGVSSKSRTKARWWASRAVGLDPEGNGGGGGPGLSNLVISRAQLIGTTGLADLLDELERMNAFRRLKDATFSWVDGAGTTATQQHQLARSITFLRSHATSLESIKLETDARLTVHFSVNRLGHTFPRLRSLEMRSTAATVTAPDVFILPNLLPPHDQDEEDWAPLDLEKLVLVGPVWRLTFDDGTTAHTTLAAADCPRLESLELGPTAPTMTWDLFSLPALHHLTIHRQPDQPSLPPPSLSRSAPTLETLSLIACPALTTRLTSLLLSTSSYLPNLTSLNLTGATLSTSLLSHFSSTNSPHLTKLFLPRSNSLPNESILLPSFAAVELVDFSLCQWVTNRTIEDMGTTMPNLERINMSGCTGVGGKIVVELVERRMKGGGKGIKELSLSLCEGVKSEEVGWLRANLRQGGFRHSYPPLVDDVRRARR